MSIPTPHISAKKGDFAKTVLMPGDPLRSQFIAETYLENPVLVNNVRGVQGYTGTWKGMPVSVMASGMGMPSIGIYSWELFNEYDVETIIRIGSAGALSDKLELRDIVAGQAACSESAYTKGFGIEGNYCPIADFDLLNTAVAVGKEMGIKVNVGNILSSDNFYHPAGFTQNEKWKKMGVLAIEMEAAALYANAAYFGKNALCLCSITDHIFREEALPSEARRLTLRQMIEIALNTAARLG